MAPAGIGIGKEMEEQASMSRKRLVTTLVLLVVGGLYWLAVCHAAGVREPWDADAYWRLWYPVSLGLSAIAGYHLKGDGWQAGMILIVGQLPVMLINSGMGPLFAAGLLFTGVLAVPAVTISLLAGVVAMRRCSA